MSDAFSPQPSEDNEPGAHGLEPNLADINAHLYAIFGPDFVKDHPGTWIEIATADPEAGEGNTGPKSARQFSVFKLEEAAAYAVRMNKKGRNIYVGMALRQGETGPSGRANKANVVTSSRGGWGDFDKEGDDVRILASLSRRACWRRN